MRDWISRNHWIGFVLLAGGVASVALYRRAHEPEAYVPPPRPLKTMVVGAPVAVRELEFPGRVAATEQVTMAFEYGGTLKELPVREGDRVSKGQMLARLDPSDAQNQLDAAEAELKRAEAQLERMRIAAEAKAVSLQELSNAEAGYAAAAAQRNIQLKLLRDTELKASFDGVIARVMAKNFESVQAKQPILSLQDLSAVEISASIPESQIARLRPQPNEDNARRFDVQAEFDFIPGRLFDLAFKEFSTEADSMTQAFTAKFTLSSPDDVSILPGMACSVRVLPRADAGPNSPPALEVPADAVPIDGVGQYYVWIVVEADDGLHQTVRRNVVAGALVGDNVQILGGLAAGDRIALAGVHVLREGTLVRLIGNDSAEAP
jgi:membrane fusion protein, multidrug efflux system